MVSVFASAITLTGYRDRGFEPRWLLTSLIGWDYKRRPHVLDPVPRHVKDPRQSFVKRRVLHPAVLELTILPPKFVNINKPLNVSVCHVK